MPYKRGVFTRRNIGRLPFCNIGSLFSLLAEEMFEISCCAQFAVQSTS